MTAIPLPEPCQGCQLITVCRFTEEAPGAFCRTLTRNELLYRQGEAALQLYVPLSGSLRLCRLDANDQPRLVDFAFPGEVIGLEAIGESYYQAQVLALEASRICILPTLRLERWLVANPTAAFRLARLLSAQLARMHQQGSLTGRRAPDTRLAAFLVILARRLGRGRTPARLHLSMARWEIARVLGLRTETVSRYFHELERRGLIRICCRELELTDWEGLEALAALPRLEAMV
ncbi:MAG: Crp/Fnr family transcriptional regulator [Candidatus Competibacteraceae bacterium]|nr:Crp/Fnr family transcriptional regulator [Candidatus Competibacteraceae bacterium]